jgi:hypothetical protein
VGREGKWAARTRDEKRSTLSRRIAEEKARLNYGTHAKEWNENNALDAVADLLGMKRRPGEQNNAFFARMEGSPAFETLRQKIITELKGQAPSLAKRLEAEDDEKKASFMEELQKL